MPETKISSAISSDLTQKFVTQADETVDATYKIPSQVTDAASDQKETEWTNPNWSQYFGYFNQIPELNAAINAKATWTIGKGFKADEATTMLLGTIKGWGKDTFNTILENCVRTYHIGGDSFCEIIRDSNGNLINLKPLDPYTIKLIVNGKGIIIRYEQTAKTGEKKTLNKWEPHEIFHLARNRVADQIHGVSIIEPIESIILMRNEAMADWKRVLHRNIDPLWIFHMDTDDPTEIAAFKAKMDSAHGGENLYVPKGVVVPEMVGVAPNASLNPLPWIDSLNEYFYEAVGVPKIIIGSSRAFTEASAKIAYLAFQQTIEEEQLFIEEEVLEQLNLEIELEFPASLENELLSDKKKDGDMTESKPSETTAGEGE